jgi:hypothetical protein
MSKNQRRRVEGEELKGCEWGKERDGPAVTLLDACQASVLTVDNVNILYVNKQEKWFKYKNIHRSRV